MSRFFRFSVVVAAFSSAFAAFTAFSSSAHATCLITCKADLTFEDCTQPPMATWPLGTPLTFTASCEECCNGPGGPQTCTPSAVDTSTFSISDENFNPIAGSFAPKNKKCADTDLYGFDGTLELGPLNIVAENLIIVQFDVVESAVGAGGAGSSSVSSGSTGGTPGQGGGGEMGCVMGRPSSEGGAGIAMTALALLGLVAGRRSSRRASS